MSSLSGQASEEKFWGFQTSTQFPFIWSILNKREDLFLKDYGSMSKEELIANIEELKANLEIIKNAFQDIKNASSLKIPDEAYNKLQEELNKTREGLGKLEKLLSE